MSTYRVCYFLQIWLSLGYTKLKNQPSVRTVYVGRLSNVNQLGGYIMAATVRKDCIVRSDGSILGWDKESNELYVLSKKEITFDELSKEDLLALLTLFTTSSIKVERKVLTMTQEEIDCLLNAVRKTHEP